MQKYARVVNNVALEVFTPPAGVTIEQCFHPALVKEFVAVPDDVTPNSTRNESGQWSIAPTE